MMTRLRMDLAQKCTQIVAFAMSLEIDYATAGIVFRALAELMEQVDKTPDASDESLAEFMKASLIAKGIPAEMLG